jgi:hypothetical protein
VKTFVFFIVHTFEKSAEKNRLLKSMIFKYYCLNLVLFVEIRLFYDNTNIILCENIFFLHCAYFRKVCRKKQAFQKSAEKSTLLKSLFFKCKCFNFWKLHCFMRVETSFLDPQNGESNYSDIPSLEQGI